MVKRRKGAGYVIEAFIASITLLIFAAGSISTPASTDWESFTREISGQDLGYALEKSGHLENFTRRGETGSLQTAVSTISGGRMQVAGTVKNLPLSEKLIGFYNLPRDIHQNFTVEVTPGDRCSGDLGEIDSQPGEPVRRTVDTPGSLENRRGVRLYLADIDPNLPSNEFNGEEDYDTVWVDNGTTCQFTASEGPHLVENIFFWGNTSDSKTDIHYDLKKISKNGDSFTVYRAEQLSRLRDTMRKPVNSIPTEVEFDTFNFSKNDLSVYDMTVFRQDESLERIDSSDRRRDQVLGYLEERPAIFLMNLNQGEFKSSDFMQLTGMKWIDLPSGSSPYTPEFSDSERSRELRTFFRGQNGDTTAVSFTKAGSISSGLGNNLNSKDKMLYAAETQYDGDKWNATNLSMKKKAPAELTITGADWKCGTQPEYRNGSFKFPDQTYQVVSAKLGTEAGSCSDIWGLGIDLNRNNNLENDEKIFLENESLKVKNRQYLIQMYSSEQISGCSRGSCIEFVYTGSERIELVNFRTEFESREVDSFALAGYEEKFEPGDRKLLSSLAYTMTEEDNLFGSQQSTEVSTTVIGSISKQVYMPYTVSLRWYD